MKINTEKIKLGENERIFDKHFTIIVNKQLGKGGFGQIYLGRNIRENVPIAIKVEESSNRSHLRLEYEILKDIQGGKGIPRIYKYRQGHNHNYLVIMINILHIKRFSKLVTK